MNQNKSTQKKKKKPDDPRNLMKCLYINKIQDDDPVRFVAVPKRLHACQAIEFRT